METFGQIIGIVFAVLLLVLAYKLYAKDKIPSCVFVVWASVFILLCSFPWFQGWAKSFIASKITSKLEALGQQVNTVQETTTEMHKQLENHQIEIDKHQRELDDVQAKIRVAETNVINDQSDITNQFQKISMLQSDLAIAQTNLASQEKELSDVEYWVQNLYGKMVNETFSIQDTNHILIISLTNDAASFFARLSQVPIVGSVEEYARDAHTFSEHREYLGGIFDKNITRFTLFKYDTNSLIVSFHYVADTRETNYYRHMPVLNKEIWLFQNGAWFVKPLP